MFQLITLEEQGYLDAKIESLDEDEFDAWNGSIIRRLKTRQNPDYSSELRHTVRNCLNLKPESRPDVSTLLHIIDAGLKSCRDQMYQEAAINGWPLAPGGEKVYFRENEINQMPQGPYDFNLSEKWWERFNQHETWDDPDWEPLDPPLRPVSSNPQNTMQRLLKEEASRKRLVEAQKQRRLDREQKENEKKVRNKQAGANTMVDKLAKLARRNKAAKAALGHSAADEAESERQKERMRARSEAEEAAAEEETTHLAPIAQRPPNRGRGGRMLLWVRDQRPRPPPPPLSEEPEEEEDDDEQETPKAPARRGTQLESPSLPMDDDDGDRMDMG